MSPQDNFWGVGRSGKGQNKLGKILMRVREELAAAQAVEAADGPMLAAEAVAVGAAEIPQEAEVLTGPPGWSPDGAAPAPAPAQAEVLTGPPGWSPQPEVPENPVIDIADIPGPVGSVEAPKDMQAADGSKVAEWGANDNIKIIKV
jgi:hypothetical protein